MNLSHIEYLGITVKSTEEAFPPFEGVPGLTCYNIGEVVDQKVRIALLKIGEAELELLEPTSDESPTAKLIEKRGEGIHHLALSFDDVAPAFEEFKGKGIRLIGEKLRKGAGGLNIAFARPKSAHGIFLEICDYKGVAK